MAARKSRRASSSPLDGPFPGDRRDRRPGTHFAADIDHDRIDPVGQGLHREVVDERSVDEKLGSADLRRGDNR